MGESERKSIDEVISGLQPSLRSVLLDNPAMLDEVSALFCKYPELAKAVAASIEVRSSAVNSLRASQCRYKELIDSLPEAVFETDRDMNITMYNRACRNLFNYSDEEVGAGFNIRQVFPVDELPRARENINSILEGKGKNSANEYTVVDKHGSRIPVIIHSSRILDDAGNILGLRGVIVNMSERKAEASEKENLYRQLIQAQKTEALGVMAAGIAHDFNNILSAILAFPELIQESMGSGCPDMRSINEDLEVIISSAERGRDLVRKLMDFSRKSEYSPNVINLNDVVKEAVFVLQKGLAPPKWHLYMIPAAKKCVFADRVHINQVIDNLTVNARDAMPDGGIISISTKDISLKAGVISYQGIIPPGDYVVLSVSDTGAGIPKDILEKIIDPFFTTKEVGKGTGLGLSTVFGIIKKHGGYLDVETEVSQGTKFSVYLPACHDCSQLEGNSAEKKLSVSKGSVLVVDDEKAIRDISVRCLVKSGYSVETARNSAEAYSLFTRHHFDAVLIDIVMPGGGGMELYDRLKKINPDLRACFVSGYFDSEIESRIETESIRLLNKPFEISTLRAVIYDLLSEKKGVDD